MSNAIAPPGFQLDPDSNAVTRLWHLDGMPWSEAKIPRRWHFCQPQTIGVDMLTRVERCACGAIRLDYGRWMERNSSRRVRA